MLSALVKVFVGLYCFLPSSGIFRVFCEFSIHKKALNMSKKIRKHYFWQKSHIQGFSYAKIKVNNFKLFNLFIRATIMNIMTM